MTLCMAWIRKNGQEEELIMATDSRLTGGESWDSGVKLFELPRLDCLLCFSGATSRAYPLILNSISSIKFDNNLASPHTDIHDVLEYLIDLFSTLVGEIKETAGNVDDFRGEAQFLFDFKLNRQSVSIPAGDAGGIITLHDLIAGNNILKGAGQDMMNTGAAVGGGRTFVKIEPRAPSTVCNTFFEYFIFFPQLKSIFFHLRKTGMGVYRTKHKEYLFLSFKLSPLPQILRYAPG